MRKQGSLKNVILTMPPQTAEFAATTPLSMQTNPFIKPASKLIAAQWVLNALIICSMRGKVSVGVSPPLHLLSEVGWHV